MNTTPIPPESDLLHWEDFPAGAVRDCGSTLVSREAVLDFARQFDPQPFHVDDEAAKNSLFGGLAASGWHTCSMAMRLMCDAYLLRSTSLGSPGIDELRWLKPVHPGDRLRLRMTVLAARPMRSKPDVGLVQSQWELFNQHDDCVLSMKGWGMFKRRAPGAEGPEAGAQP
jgi:acyl dehydratase